MKQKGKALGYVLFTLAVAAFVMMAALTASAIRELGTSYREASEMDPTGGSVVQLGYFDHLYADVGQGMEFAPNDTNFHQTLAEFLEDTLRFIQLRVLAAGLIYAVVVSVPMALLFASLHPGEPDTSARLTALAGLLAYVLFVVVAVVSAIVFDVPLYLPRSVALIALLAGFFGIELGNMVVGLIVGTVRHKGLVTVIAIPVALALVLFGIVTAFFVFSEPYVDSFDYVAEADSQALEEGYYDSERNVLVVGDTEYAPEQLPNPEHATGAARIGAIAYEVLNPYSGSVIELVREDLDIDHLIIVAYLVRSFVLTFVLSSVVLDRIEDKRTSAPRTVRDTEAYGSWAHDTAAGSGKAPKHMR